METIGSRIKLARTLRGMTQQDIASHFKISRVSVAQWEGRGNSPEPDKIPELARLLTTSTDWLIKAQGKPPSPEDIADLKYEPIEENDPNWVLTPDADGEGYDRDTYRPKIPGAIPELDAKAGAGEGAVGEVMVLPMGLGTISAHKIVDEWRLPPSYLREAVRNPDRAIVLPINGDSMMPNYAPGDRVVVDLSEHELLADGVYLISDGVNAPQIKRMQIVQFTNPPKCRIISDNTAYQAIEVETSLVQIMGKVSAYIGRR